MVGVGVQNLGGFSLDFLLHVIGNYSAIITAEGCLEFSDGRFLDCIVNMLYQF